MLSVNIEEASELARLMIGPTERSIPPVITTEVWAVQANMSVIAWLEVEVVTEGSKKRGFRMAFSAASTRNTRNASKTRKLRLRKRLMGRPVPAVGDTLLVAIR